MRFTIWLIVGLLVFDFLAIYGGGHTQNLAGVNMVLAVVAGLVYGAIRKSKTKKVADKDSAGV
jgi:cytochrome b